MNVQAILLQVWHSLHCFAWKNNWITTVLPFERYRIRKRRNTCKKDENKSLSLFFSSLAASTGTHTHSSVTAKVTNLLVWVQEIKFGKQSGAASRQKSPAVPASGCLRSGRSACWSPALQLHFALWVNTGPGWDHSAVFSSSPNCFHS